MPGAECSHFQGWRGWGAYGSCTAFVILIGMCFVIFAPHFAPSEGVDVSWSQGVDDLADKGFSGVTKGVHENSLYSLMGGYATMALGGIMGLGGVIAPIFWPVEDNQTDDNNRGAVQTTPRKKTMRGNLVWGLGALALLCMFIIGGSIGNTSLIWIAFAGTAFMGLPIIGILLFAWGKAGCPFPSRRRLVDSEADNFLTEKLFPICAAAVILLALVKVASDTLDMVREHRSTRGKPVRIHV